jgi:secreted PhoX family phosphatase
MRLKLEILPFVTLIAFMGPLPTHVLADFRSGEQALMQGVEQAGEQWDVVPLVTVGERSRFLWWRDINSAELDYRPPGVMDGIAAFRLDQNTVRVLVNHELDADIGYAYELDNGSELRGARVSYFDINTASRRIASAGLAYRRVFDRRGEEVSDARQINEGFGEGGFDSFCSSQGVEAASSDFVDDLYFMGEEADEFGQRPGYGMGGQEVVIDVHNTTAYVVPMLGRAAFENVAPVQTGSSDKVALLIGDDRQAAPLYLYLGDKDAEPVQGYQPPAFLLRNGLGVGRLYAWVADNGDRSPEQFHGTGASRNGHFVAIKHFDPAFANQPNHDALGFVSLAAQDIRAKAAGAFMFSRPEDIALNPAEGSQLVLASTGRGGLFAHDNWGAVYRIDVDFGDRLAGDLDTIERIPAALTVLYDADDAGGGQFKSADFGLRSPDNLDWADDGNIYIQEDRSTVPAELFGDESSHEASLWRMDPASGRLTRLLEMNRAALPRGQEDKREGMIGAWESSGVLDVSRLFAREDKDSDSETLLLVSIQAHGLSGGGLGKGADRYHDLVEGGQLLLIRGVVRSESE